MTEFDRAVQSVDLTVILVQQLEKELRDAKSTLARRQKRLRDVCPHKETNPGIYGDAICDVCGKNLT